jgi:serine protease inhibitor
MSSVISFTIDDSQRELVVAYTEFGFKLFAEIARQDYGKNIFVSPFSIATVLALACNGAGGDTRQAIARVLGVQGKNLEEVNRANAALLVSLEKFELELPPQAEEPEPDGPPMAAQRSPGGSLLNRIREARPADAASLAAQEKPEPDAKENAQAQEHHGTLLEHVERGIWKPPAPFFPGKAPSFHLITASSLWTRQEITLRPEFIQQGQDFFHARVAALDFSDPEAAAGINAWVSEATHKRIHRIIDHLDPLAMFVLLNAVYFKASWHLDVRFHEEDTQDGPFTLLDGSQKQVPMMTSPKAWTPAYYRGPDFQVISLPYEIRASMIIVLPDGYLTPDTLAGFLSGLTATNWQDMVASLNRKGMTKIVMPRFKLAYDVRLNDSLGALGMASAFDKQHANFEGIGAPPPAIWMDEVRHKTWLDVNERGTEAAATTVVSMSIFGVSREPPPTIVVDRPFFCAIRDNLTGALLFMGLITEPT